MATTDEAYCTEAQVEAITQMGDYTELTTPTEAEVLEFMENRAAMLYALLVEYMGQADAVGPAGYANPIDTSTDAGLALSYALRSLNATGAAYDVLDAAGASTEPARSEKTAELLLEWEGRADILKPLAQAYLGVVGRSETHMTSEITARSVTSKEEEGWPTDGSTEW